jgi:hypothetical protein
MNAMPATDVRAVIHARSVEMALFVPKLLKRSSARTVGMGLFFPKFQNLSKAEA